MSSADDHPILDDAIVSQLVELGPDVVVELIELYGSQLATLMPDVRSADATTARRAAHTLKGSSANLGLARVAALAAGVEAGSAAADTVDLLEPAARDGLAALRARTS